MQFGGQHLRARLRGGQATYGDHHPARIESAPRPRSAVIAWRRLYCVAPRFVPQPSGAGLGSERVQLGGQEEWFQVDGDARGSDSDGGGVDA